MTGNHKPGLRSVDEAIRRRINIILFNVTIPKEQRDLDLVEKLKAEAAGILRWMVDGCLEWQRDGLAPPPAIVEATEAYLDEEDEFKRWVDECCDVDPSQWTSFRDLFDVWKVWTEASGVHTGSAKSFSKKLENHGFTKARRTRDGFIGLTTTRADGPAEFRTGQPLVRRIWEPKM